MARVLIVEHEANAGVGIIGDRLHAAGIGMVIVGPETGREVPNAPDGFDGVVVLGGTPGPTDDETAVWLPRVRKLISACLDREVPLLGVCLGGQLLAVAAGGSVIRARYPEIGLGELRLTDAAADDPLFGTLPPQPKALQWHFLEIIELPAGSVALATSERCTNQAFRLGRVAWGTQFHLEATTKTASDWARPDSDALRLLGLTRPEVVDPMQRDEDELRTTWSTVADRWASVVAREVTQHMDKSPGRRKRTG
ncbi:type 1 glutamine amidotransferase [Arthrobacter sp. 18067]|uniref:type 1 glutamine amidotransferase n=1 Tax=Arthrobacter sp. 18067 TaxID=2681413 RepID=UPI001359E55E|nr:type 1 glutamine amidotransferase [Arthrobacter sp. 18067]